MKRIIILLMLLGVLIPVLHAQEEGVSKARKLPSTKVIYTGGTGMIRKVLLDNIKYPNSKFLEIICDTGANYIPVRMEMMAKGPFYYGLNSFAPPEAASVDVKLKIDREGKIKETIVLNCDDSLIIEAAKNACLSLTAWKPATVNKIPVDSTVEFKIPFDDITSEQLIKSGNLFPPYDYSPKNPIPAAAGVIHGRLYARKGNGIGSMNPNTLVYAMHKTNGKIYAIGCAEPRYSAEDFYAFLEPGDYMLLFHQYCLTGLIDSKFIREGIFKDKTILEIQQMKLSPKEISNFPRYEFTVQAGKINYVGVWDFTDENTKFFIPADQSETKELKGKPIKIDPSEIVALPQ